MSDFKVKNVGILAHIDAGKTTLSEQFLYKSNVLKELGSVDKGTTYTDNLEIERKRGISVKSSEANFIWKNTEINIIDTPGHIDFSPEVERAIRVLDCAILLVSAPDGVKPQTEIYFKALRDMNIPTVIFINKIDRMCFDMDKTLDNIKQKLTKDIVPIQTFKDSKLNFILSNDNKEIDNFIENLAENDDEILEKYLNNSLSMDFLKSKLKTLINECKIYPVLFGSALKGIGINELLDFMVDFIDDKHTDNDELSAIVYKIRHDKTKGKSVYLRIFSGEIKSKDLVHNFTRDVFEKVNQIKKLKFQKEIDCNKIESGNMAYVYGFNKAKVGDIIGSDKNVPKLCAIREPLLIVRVIPNCKGDDFKLRDALFELQEEDPFLNVEWIEDKKEINIRIMGMMQTEVLENILKDRFNLSVSFGKPDVIYKETPKKSGIGFASYTMPKPCWAVVKFQIEPLESGKGVIYETKVRTEYIKLKYQKEVEKQIPITLKQGLYGWEVTDLKITLVDGEDHVMHSNPGDFLIATAMGIMNGLSNVGTCLLEPILDFKISIQEELAGKVLNDILKMRGKILNNESYNKISILEGEVPVSEFLDYPINLGIMSKGKAIVNTKFKKYDKLPFELGKTKERIGVNPLDRAKYILYARNAIK